MIASVLQPITSHPLLNAIVAAIPAVIFASGTAFADAGLDQAASKACSALKGTGGLVSAIQHDETGDGTLVRGNLESWVPSYNQFAKSPAARLLRREAIRRAAMAKAAYPRHVCQNLKPLVALAVHASMGASSGLRFHAGHILMRCKSGFCIPRSIELAGERCDFQPLAIPPQPVC